MEDFYKPVKCKHVLLARFAPKDLETLRKKIKTIAIYKSGGGLGDLSQSAVYFRAFKKLFPEAEVAYLGLYQKYVCGKLFEAMPYKDRYIEYLRPLGKKDMPAYNAFRKEYAGKFDLIVDTQANFWPSLAVWWLRPKYFLSRNMLFSNWKIIEKKKQHVVSKIMALAEALAGEPVPADPVAHEVRGWEDEARRYLAGKGDKFVCIIPVVGDKRKFLDQDMLARAADLIAAQGYRIILIGAASERPILAAFAEKMKEKPLVPILDMPEVANEPLFSVGLFRCSLATAGADSGGLHLSIFSGCPVVAVYTFSSPIKSGPLGNGNIVLDWKAKAGTAEDVAAAVMRVIEKRAKALK
jgi:ADP-heptose:LPS heptosyltransferase